jgi:putative multiple sugar transport system permease protein
MGIINQGMSIADTPVNYQKVVKGIVLILAVLFDVMMQMKRKGAKKAKNVAASEKGGANV